MILIRAIVFFAVAIVAMIFWLLAYDLTSFENIVILLLINIYLQTWRE